MGPLGREGKIIAIFCGIISLVWIGTKPVFRFLIPIMPLLAVLASRALADKNNRFSYVARLLFFLFLPSHFFLYFFVTDVFRPFRTAMGIEERQSYLTKRLDYYSCAKFINTHVPKESTIYILGDQRTFYINRKTIASSIFAPNPFQKWIPDKNDSQTLIQNLRSNGITHVMENHREGKRIGLLPMEPKAQKHWETISRKLPKIYSDQNVTLYALEKI